MPGRRSCRFGERGGEDMSDSDRNPFLIVLVLVVLGAGLALYFALKKPDPAPPAPPAAPTPPAEAPAPAPPPAPAEDQPPRPAEPAIEPSDEQIRTLAAGCVGHPSLARWLENQAIIGKAVAVVDLIARGESPRKLLSALGPEGNFRTLQREGREYLDPQSYERYTPLADAIEALDPKACAQLYQRLEPWLEKKYREIGEPGRTFRLALADAIGELLKVPAFEGDIPLSTTAVNMKMDLPELEALSDAQKHLLRMGPKNVRRVQARLRALGQALGLQL